MNNVRKLTGFVLVGLIVITTLIAILGIWDVIELEEAVRKLLLSLLIIFISSAVVLFITTVLIKDEAAKDK
jgi:hypothetical protein